MTLTAGAITLVSTTSTTASFTATAATSGTAPYAYQWYRSTTSGFSPGGGNIIAGAITSTPFTDTGLIPNTLYYYKLVVTDAASATATYTQVAATTGVPTLSQNQFTLQPFLGTVDQMYNYDTVPVLIDVSQATPLYAGAGVKFVDSADGVPKVVGCAANSDSCVGFINYNIKNINYAAGVAAEISTSGNVIYLYATTAIPRGSRVTLDLSTNGGVGVLVGSSGASIVGWAFDKATTAGTLIRVKLQSPTFAVA